MSNTDWIEWHGGECPVADGTLVEVMFKDGTVECDFRPEWSPSMWNWYNNIIAYRIISQPNTHNPVTSPALKDDGDKLRYDLVPPEALAALASVLTYGANKYGDRNWEKGFRWGRLFGACMRHLWAWWGGENEDPETGMSHLWHALACVAFMVAHEERCIGVDDRKVKE